MVDSKNITLKVKSELYDLYRELCKKEGWIVSRQFEKLMEDELKKRGREIWIILHLSQTKKDKI